MSNKSVTNSNITTRNGHKQEISLTQSPLPSADELAKLQKVNPELPNKIAMLAEKEQNHRHLIENNKLEILQKNAGSNRFIGNFGITAGSVLLGCFGFGSMHLILSGHEVIGSLGAFVSALAVFSGMISNAKDKNTPI